MRESQAANAASIAELGAIEAFRRGNKEIAEKLADQLVAGDPESLDVRVWQAPHAQLRWASPTRPRRPSATSSAGIPPSPARGWPCSSSRSAASRTTRPWPPSSG